MILIQHGSLLLFPLLTLMTFLGSLPFFPRMSGTETGELFLLNLCFTFRVNWKVVALFVKIWIGVVFILTPYTRHLNRSKFQELLLAKN